MLGSRSVGRRCSSLFADLLRSGLDLHSTDPALLRRVRTFNQSTLTLVTLALPLGVLTSVVGKAWEAVLLLALVGASVANVLLLRRTKRPTLSGHFSTAMLFTLLVVEVASNGGFYQPGFAWLYVVPVAAGTLIGARGCVVWVVICSSTVLAFWFAAHSGLDMAPRMIREYHPLISLASHLSAVISLGILALGFTTAQRQLEVQLQARSEQLRIDSGFTRLLHEAAAASNESRSLDEALRSSLELICQALDWPIARVYSTSTEERHVLRARAIRFAVAEERLAAFAGRYAEAERVRSGELATQAMHSRVPLWIEDVGSEPDLPHAELARAAGIGAAVLVPIQVGDGVVAVLEFFAQKRIERNVRLLEYFEQIAAQIGHAAERLLAREQMRCLVFFDSLTGLPNRRLFQERLEMAITSAALAKSQLALFFLDLDGFKTVNDTLGHEAGDKLLAAVAARLSHVVRVSDCVARITEGDGRKRGEDDAVARLGGDEFTVLLPRVSNRSAAAIVGERLLGAFREPFRLDNREIFTGASIGIALYPDDGRDLSNLVRSADIAMYHAKERGRNNFQFFSAGLGTRGVRRLALEGRLCRAVENEEFELHYQPVRHADRGHVVGAEALLRWTDAEVGSVSPAEFIPVAERCGQIERLGTWVIRSAAAQARAWVDAGLRPIRVSVNVSGYQVRHPRIVQTIREALARNRVEGRWFELELTESIIMQDDRITHEILHELRSLGVGLALDDFGTGYSSLSYLRRFPISCVKIDRTFIADIPDKHDDCALVSAIIAMAHRLRIRVVAEGVETEAQLAFLRQRRCDEVQGHLFSPAVSAAEFAQMLHRERDHSNVDA